MSSHISFENHCLYCLKEKNQVEWLKPIYDWSAPDKVIGWFCNEHYKQVNDFQRTQEFQYEEYKEYLQKLYYGDSNKGM